MYVQIYAMLILKQISQHTFKFIIKMQPPHFSLAKRVKSDADKILQYNQFHTVCVIGLVTSVLMYINRFYSLAVGKW